MKECWLSSLDKEKEEWIELWEEEMGYSVIEFIKEEQWIAARSENHTNMINLGRLESDLKIEARLPEKSTSKIYSRRRRIKAWSEHTSLTLLCYKKVHHNR